MGLSLIIAHEPSEAIDTDYFVEQLKKKWSDVEIDYISEPNAPILQFKTDDSFGLLGRFFGTGVSYTTDRGRMGDAQFALWYRTIVPDEWELKLYDSGLTFAIMSVTKQTTQEQIMAWFEIPFDPSKYK